MFLRVVISHTHTHTQCLCISLSVGIKHACFSFVLFVDVVHTDMLTEFCVRSLSVSEDVIVTVSAALSESPRFFPALLVINLWLVIL